MERTSGLLFSLALTLAACGSDGSDPNANGGGDTLLGGGDQTNAADNTAGNGAVGADVDPWGVKLTPEEQKAGEDWDTSGLEEDDENVDDGVTDAEFQALPLSDDQAGTSDPGGPLLNTQTLIPQAGGGLVQASGRLVCTPPSAVRQAACWARGRYMGNIRVVQVDGKMVEVYVYCMVQNGKDLAKKAGKTLSVSSGWRSVDSQRRLYALYLAGRGNVAAPPGRSHHNCGHAIDYGGSARSSGWLRPNAPRFGFHFVPIRGESWHFEIWTTGPNVPR